MIRWFKHLFHHEWTSKGDILEGPWRTAIVVGTWYLCGYPECDGSKEVYKSK